MPVSFYLIVNRTFAALFPYIYKIYNEVLTFAADQAVLVPFTSAHQYAVFNSDKIDSFSFGSDQLFIEIANVKAK